MCNTTDICALPTGTYIYVSNFPSADCCENQVYFDFFADRVSWVRDGHCGTAILSGDWLKLFQSLYLSDRPVYDWLVSGPRSLEGIAGNVAGNVRITIDESGKLSRLRLDSGLVQATAALTKTIASDTLVISGITRGQPNLLHSCITLLGTANCLHLTDQGNVVLDNMTLSANRESVGLKADKLGGDTFIAGKVFVDGRVEWMNRYANLQPVTGDSPAILETNGQDMIIGGMNVGRVGRNLTFSTGADQGGDIIIGAKVSVDFARGKVIDDPTQGTLTFSTSGDIIAGLGNVIIGTNTARVVDLDVAGNIQGKNVVIRPTDNGTPTHVTATIGSVTATESIQIEVGNVNQGRTECLAIGDLTAQIGNITLIAGDVNGSIGNITALNGTVDINLASAKGVGTIAGTRVVKHIGAPAQATKATFISNVTVNGEAVSCSACEISGDAYVRLRDLACALSGSEKQFQMEWFDDVSGAEITLKSGQPCTKAGNPVFLSGTNAATSTSWNIYLDGTAQSIISYSVAGVNYFNAAQLAKALNFRLSHDTDTKTLKIDTQKEI